MAAVSVLQILRTIKEKGSISRTDLQQITGLSWGTVTNTTRELLNRQLIREEGALSTRAGRKPMRLALNPTQHCLIGAEVAPGALRCLVMNLAGEALGYEQESLAAGEAPEIALKRLAELVQRGIAAHSSRQCMGVGVALPGALDVKQGILRYAPQLPAWRDVAVRSTLQGRLPVPVRVEHNPNCLALAERWFGQAGKVENLLCIHLGEGVGLGILIEGEILRGSQELAGEFGHVTLDPQGPRCACGDRGCVEAYCSRSALVEFARSRAGSGDTVATVKTVEELAALAGQGNAAAKEAFERMGQYLGVGVANLIDLFNPELIVLAGKSTAGKEHFMPGVEQAMERHAWKPSSRRILVSQLGERATAMGACGMILQMSFEHEENHRETLSA